MTDTATNASTRNAAAAEKTVLRLLSGFQSGAEVLLSSGQYSIGSGDENDVVLQDATIAPEHLLLRIDTGGLWVEARDRDVATSGGLLASGEGKELPFGSVIGLGRTFIAIGAEGTDWDSLPIPEPVTEDRSAPRSASSGADAAAPSERVGDDTSDPSSGDVSRSGAAPETRALDFKVDTDAAPSAVGKRAGVWSRRSVAVIGAIVAAVGTLVVVVFYGTVSETPMAQRGESWAGRLSVGKSLLSQLGLVSVAVRVGRDGTLVFEGYTGSESAKAKLSDALKQRGIPAENRTWPLDLLRRSVGQTLARLGGADLSYEVAPDGAVNLRGYLGQDLAEDELVAMLRTDVPGISRVDSEVRTLAGSVAALRKAVRDAGLEKQVSISSDGGALVAEGVLSRGLMSTWGNVARRFDSDTGGVPELVSRVKALEDSFDTPLGTVRPSTAKDPAAALQTRLVVIGIAIVKDQVAFALFSDNRVARVGDPVDSNYVVESIASDRVTLRYGNQAKILYLGGRQWEKTTGTPIPGSTSKGF
ncbi:MAG: hypothetical protein H6955_20020 [Chromatiaceae bacterium]|nr:hypothetical protein [Chromatiaceae bacterium]